MKKNWKKGNTNFELNSLVGMIGDYLNYNISEFDLGNYVICHLNLQYVPDIPLDVTDT